jgi:hypothetical protein
MAAQAGWQYADMSQVHRPLARAALCVLATDRGPAAVGEYVQTAAPVGRK